MMWARASMNFKEPLLYFFLPTQNRAWPLVSSRLTQPCLSLQSWQEALKKKRLFNLNLILPVREGKPPTPFILLREMIVQISSWRSFHSPYWAYSSWGQVFPQQKANNEAPWYDAKKYCEERENCPQLGLPSLMLSSLS